MVGDLDLQRGVALAGLQAGVDGAAAGGVQERGRIAAVNLAQRVGSGQGRGSRVGDLGAE